MADKKLNEVQKVTDMAYVPVIMADGSIGQIAKADLASVVAELMSNSHLFPYMYKGDLLRGKTCDEYRTTGVYGIRIASNVPSDSPVNTSSLYGVLVVHVAPFVAQIAYLNNGNAYYRMYTNESWSVWGQLC